MVEEAKKRAIVIKKHEKAYSALDSMEYHIERLGKCMEDLKGVSVPVLKVKEDADKTDDDSKAKILDF